MQGKTLLLATLLVLGAVAIAPTASADHAGCDTDIRTVKMACDAVDAGVHYAECYLYTGPAFWLDQCV